MKETRAAVPAERIDSGMMLLLLLLLPLADGAARDVEAVVAEVTAEERRLKKSEVRPPVVVVVVGAGGPVVFHFVVGRTNFDSSVWVYDPGVCGADAAAGSGDGGRPNTLVLSTSMAWFRYSIPPRRRRSWDEAMNSSMAVSFSSRYGWTYSS